jgi:twinkle protein
LPSQRKVVPEEIINPVKKLNLSALKKCRPANMMTAYTEYRQVHKNGLPPGKTTGWSGFDQYYMSVGSRLQVVSGTPGSGKSEWVQALMMNRARMFGSKGMVYSPENYPVRALLRKFAENYIGKPFYGYGNIPPMPEEDAERAFEFIKKTITIIDPDQYCSVQEIFDLALLTKKIQGLDMLVMDPWNKIRHERNGKTETEYILDVLVNAGHFARVNEIDVWIVAHLAKMPRKKDGEFCRPSLFDISGSAHWYNCCDNAFILHRSMERKKSKSKLVDVMVEKIKEDDYGECADVTFRYDRLTRSYRVATEIDMSEERNGADGWN